MKRREFITRRGGAAATWPLAARAQQPERVRRIGVLNYLAADDPDSSPRVAAFAQALQGLGWFEGRNIRRRSGSRCPPRCLRGLMRSLSEPRRPHRLNLKTRRRLGSKCLRTLPKRK